MNVNNIEHITEMIICNSNKTDYHNLNVQCYLRPALNTPAKKIPGNPG